MANMGNLIVTGVGRFANNVYAAGYVKNGSSGSYALLGNGGHIQIAQNVVGSTLVQRDSRGYIFADYFNASCKPQTPDSDACIIYANSDGYFRKASLANIKTILGLGSAAYTDSTKYVYKNNTANTLAQFSGAPSFLLGIESFGNGGTVKWQDASSVSVGSATSANQMTMSSITIQTGSSTQSHITLETLMNWLINTKKIVNSNNKYHSFSTSWAYANNDILQISINGSNKEVQLAGVIFEIWGSVSAYNNGLFRLRIHTALSHSYTNASGYSHIGDATVIEYFCNGSGYSPTWRYVSDRSLITAQGTAGLYKIAYDNGGHITATSAITKADITGLGIPGSDTNTTYSFATGDNNGTFKVTPSGGSATNIAIKGLGSAAYTASSAYATASHTHGLGHSDFTTFINVTTNTWAAIGVDGRKHVLKSIRTDVNAPPYLLNSYSAGIVFGGADTRGLISMAYASPKIRFAGGHNTTADSGTATWYFTVTGTHNKTYNFDTINQVTQSSTTTVNYRGIVLGTNNTGSISTTRETTVTGECYITDKIFAQPSSGTLYATHMYAWVNGNASVSVGLIRSGYSSWRILNNGGTFELQNNWYNNTTQSWYTVARFDHSCGGAIRINTPPTHTSSNRYINYQYNGISIRVCSKAGWAIGTWWQKNDNSATLGSFGAYGAANALSYYYWGTAYNSTQLRLYPGSGGGLVTQQANGFRMVNAGYGVIFRTDSTHFYILLTDKKTNGSELTGDNWNGKRPLMINFSTGICDINGNASTSTIAKTVYDIDASSLGDTIGIGYAGAGLTTSEATHVACFTSKAAVQSGATRHIKDLSFANLKTKLGLDYETLFSGTAAASVGTGTITNYTRLVIFCKNTSNTTYFTVQIQATTGYHYHAMTVSPPPAAQTSNSFYGLLFNVEASKITVSAGKYSNLSSSASLANGPTVHITKVIGYKF